MRKRHSHSTSATAAFVPAPRLPPPLFDTTEITVEAPPQLARPARQAAITRLLPVVMAVATVAMMAVVYCSRSGMARNPAFVAFPLMMLASAVATVAAGRDRQRAEIDSDRADYLGYLSDLREAVTKTAAAQHTSLAWCHPDPDMLWTLVGGSRMWERRSADSDFCHVRVGTGTLRLATRLAPPPIGSLDRLDPVTVTALRSFLRAHATIPDAPIAVALRGLCAVTIAGDTTHARGLARGMICQLTALHGPNRVLVVGVIGGPEHEWDWLKWLPHNQHPTATDDAGTVRMVYPTLAAAENALGATLTEGAQHRAAPQVVIIVDGDVVDGSERIIAGGGMPGVTILEVGTGCDGLAATDGVRLQVAATALAVRLADDDEVFAHPDRVDLDVALACARRLAAYHAGEADAGLGYEAGGARWQDLLDIGHPAAFRPTALWERRSPCDRLCVPIGTTAAGAPLALDIKEAAENGMGPHGLCVGATGSGKSEFLRTVALGMISRHSPQMLNLILVDFKGGATFLGLEQVPHVAAVITNLADEAPLVARMREALTGEMYRRQELLRAAGNLDSVAAYERARSAGAPLAALPALFVIVDEFSELLSQHPDFGDVFVAIGRLGRSLGMHLLLASQRLDEGRLRGLESHLSYRVCLKTLSANESRIVLGTSDAYELPGTPGAGYLRTATAELIRFDTAFVSGPCPPAATIPPASHRGEAPPPARLFSAAPAGPITHADGASPNTAAQRTVLQTVVDRLSGHGPSAHQVWLPPLGSAPALDTLLCDAGPELSVPIGIVDRPFEQRRTPLIVDVSGSAGNVAVVGAPQSGKSTALRTLVTALAATHDPRRVQFYCLDFGGGTLGPLRALPHVGAVAGRTDPHLVERTIAELEAIIRSREALFSDQSIDSIAHYRRLKAQCDSVCDRFGDVFLVVDGWAGLRHEFDVLEHSITAVAAQGLSFGVHVVVSASRWAEIRPALKDQLGSRIELRLGDPADSELDRRSAGQVPEGKPGRGLSRDGLHMVVALPRLDGRAATSGLVEAARQAGQMLRRRHGGAVAPPILVLPKHVEHHHVVGRAADGPCAGLLLGLQERGLQPVAVDFQRHGHLLILGDSECGKTATLRTLCREIVRTTPAAQAQLVIVDFRRGLLGVVESEHLGAYVTSAAALHTALSDLLDLLRRRMPPPDVTQQQLRTRSWWSGSDIYVVVDDYDLVATASDGPLSPLVEYLPHAGDLGLHLLVARRSGGAARAMFEPLVAELRDVGCMALIMSANPDEGPLIGSIRPSPLPPGRGTLITRSGGKQLVQVSWSPP